MARDRRDDDDDDRPRRARRPRDDDDDDDRPRSARRKPKADNTVKVLLIVGGVLVVLVLICAGVGLTVYTSIARGVGNAQQKAQQDFTKMAEQQQKEMNKSMDQMGEDVRKRQTDAANSDKAKATEAVAAFLQEVKGGRAAAAYRLMSAEFRQRTTEAAFAEFLRANAAQINNTFPPHADIFAPDTGTTYAFDISTGFKKTNVTAVKQDGKWVIDVFTVAGR